MLFICFSEIHRAEHGGAIRRIAHAQRLGTDRQAFDHLVIDLLMHQHARTGRAHLTGVEEDSGSRRFRRRFDIGVIEDDIGGFAAKLERHAFEIAGRAAQNAATDAWRSRERDLVDIGMIDQRIADHAARDR